MILMNIVGPIYNNNKTSNTYQRNNRTKKIAMELGVSWPKSNGVAEKYSPVHKKEMTGVIKRTCDSA